METTIGGDARSDESAPIIALFLGLWEQRLEVPASAHRGRARYRRQAPKGRWLGMFFGKARYWRTHMHQTKGRGGGLYPLDEKLGLTADGFSFGVLGRAVLLATKMSFAAAATTLKSFLDWSPSTKTIERATLGLGRHTEAWFEQAPPPEDDGEVLIIQLDGKGTPTATWTELDKRRGKRRPNPHPESARHRGRARRRRRGSNASPVARRRIPRAFPGRPSSSLRPGSRWASPLLPVLFWRGTGVGSA